MMEPQMEADKSCVEGDFDNTLSRIGGKISE